VTADITQYLSWEKPASFEAFSTSWKRWLSNMEAGTHVSLVVRSRSSSKFVGMLGLHGISITAEPEVGIWIRENAQNRHYGREAIGALIEWAFRTLQLKSVSYPVVDENAPSRRLVESLNGYVVGHRTHKKSETVEHRLVI